ncbi:MAG: cysteine synthase A [Clostridia bacterium]
MYYNSLTELVGHTPLLKLNRFMKKRGLQANIFAKLEYFEPASSIKDRTALTMVEKAEERGDLIAGSTIIEPTSGNTGIGLAWVCAIKGYDLILTIPENMSIERIKLVKQLGAKVVLTSADEGLKGSKEKAIELNKSIPNSFIPSQFDNPDNCLAHISTANEILLDLDKNVDYLVAGIGTGGTITGTGENIKKVVPNVKIVGIEPFSSPLISKGYAGKHNLQGIGANFVPAILNVKILDRIITVSDEDAIKTAKDLAKEEGILVGITSGASVFASMVIAKEKGNEGKNIVAILPDTGERYISTALFD